MQAKLGRLERLALHTGRLLTIAVVLVLLFQSCATRPYKNERMFKVLKSRLGKLKIKVIKPALARPNANGII